MKNILLFGAGKSSACLIDYLVENAASENWHITIADVETSIIEAKTNSASCTTAVALDTNDAQSRETLIAGSDIVISLMPPALHILIARSCIKIGRNLLTASYSDNQMQELSEDIKKAGLLFLCEMGLDPGIDHMSAMKILDQVRELGGVVGSFKSHCGGLVAPESDDNPWHYKISWNPKNVVLAGQAGALYRKEGKLFELRDGEIFEAGEDIEVADAGTLTWYPNRDSLSYIPLYHLESASTFIRTTLRHPSFCKAWNEVVWLGLTDTEDHESFSQFFTINDWIIKKLFDLDGIGINWNRYLDMNVAESFREEITEMFDWLGLFSDAKIPEKCRCSAELLQYILEEKLVLNAGDRDMVVMVHEIEALFGHERTSILSTLVVRGESNTRTAMAKTVGLPLGIAAKLILNGGILVTGLHIPIIKEIYEPVLAELELHGIRFLEKRTQSH